VKLFDAKPDVLQALSGSNIGVTVGIPNVLLKTLNSSRKVADTWVHDNVTRYVSNGAKIEYVTFLSYSFNSIFSHFILFIYLFNFY